MNVNHMSMMKTSLKIIHMCPQEHFALYKSSFSLVLFYKRDWATLLHLVYFCYLLPVTNYLITKLSVTVGNITFRYDPPRRGRVNLNGGLLREAQ